jgi:pantothenate kinase
MENKVWQRISQFQLVFDRTDTPIELDRVEVEKYYYPLACKILRHAHGQKRFMVAVAGPPASGKTAFATILVSVINAEANQEIAALVQQDGWHYSNEYLSAHTLLKDGAKVTLRQLKGAPETYDTAAAYQCFKKIKVGENVSYPVNSRETHDPVPDGGCVRTRHRIVVLEGNYLLLQEEPWQRFRSLFDLGILLMAQREALVDGLRQRHLRGGRFPAAVEEHISRVDIPNIVRVLKHSGGADILVYKADSRQIVSIVYVNEPSH